LIIECNDAAARIFGYSHEEMVGRETDFLHIDQTHFEQFGRHLMAAFEDPGYYATEFEMRRKDGGVFPTDHFVRPVHEPDGLISYVVSVVRDIINRKQAEEKLKLSEDKYRNIFDNAVEGIFQKTTEGRFITVNPVQAHIYGYSSPEEIIATITDIGGQLDVNPDDRNEFHRIIQEKGIITGFEVQQKRKDGSTFLASISARAVKDISGDILYYEGTTEDITERKHAEEQIRYERHKFSILSENAPFGMAMIDKDGSFIYINPKFKQMFGYDLSDIPDGKTWFKKAYPDPAYRHTVISAWTEDLKRAKIGEQWPEVFTVICKDGTEKMINFTPVQLETGTQIMSCEDITHRKQAEEEQKQTMEKLRKSLIGTIQALSSTVETRDPYTAGHQRMVSKLARAIAQEMGLPSDTVDTIRMAGIIHDIGKISVPAEILSKTGKISDIEMSLIKVHPQSGYDILKDVGLPYPIAGIVLQHHERLDGSGYPQGIKGDQILLEAQIVSVADVVEAISSIRPYRPAHGINVALEEIEKNKGILYNEKAVEVCIKLFREKAFKFESTES
jgi:PAS domain S-box-containing protein/putative nucleotidyltransferase with HDIG domain